MSPAQIGASIAASLVVAGFARILRLGESRIADPMTAQRMAENALAGFVAGSALVGRDGAAALVAGNSGIAVLKRHGAQVAVRRLLPPLTVHAAVEGASVDTGERMFGRVTLFGVLADDIRQLERHAAVV